MFQGLLCDLVPLSQPYQDRMLAWYNGPMREWGGALDGLMSRATFERQMERRREHSGPTSRFITFGIQARDGTPIGYYLLAHIDGLHRTAELGAGIGDSAYWGGGYGSDATLLMVEYAFNWLDLRRLYLVTMSKNIRAQRQVEKCGFTREVFRRHGEHSDGEWIDDMYYGLLREEWPGREVLIERLGLRDKARERGYV